MWLDSEGQLKKEERLGSWIHAPPFVKGSSLMIKEPGYYEARKKERQQMSNKEPSLIPVVVLGLQKSSVVVQPLAKEGVNFQEENNVKGSGPEIEERIMVRRVREN